MILNVLLVAVFLLAFALWTSGEARPATALAATAAICIVNCFSFAVVNLALWWNASGEHAAFLLFYARTSTFCAGAFCVVAACVKICDKSLVVQRSWWLFASLQFLVSSLVYLVVSPGIRWLRWW